MLQKYGSGKVCAGETAFRCIAAGDYKVEGYRSRGQEKPLLGKEFSGDIESRAIEVGLGKVCAGERGRKLSGDTVAGGSCSESFQGIQ